MVLGQIPEDRDSTRARPEVKAFPTSGQPEGAEGGGVKTSLLMLRYARKFSVGPVLVALFTFIALLPASAQQPLKTEVKVKGDLLYVEMETKGGEPQIRMNPDPSFLELDFANTRLENPKSEVIDKGLIQKVVTTQSDQSGLVRVYVLSKPKASLQKTETGYRYTVRLRDLATAPTRNSNPVASKPPEASPKPALQPKPDAQPKPQDELKPASQPEAKPVATQPAVKPVASQPAVETKPAAPPRTVEKPAPVSQPTVAAVPPVKKLVREYFPYQKKDAMRAKNAAELAFPNITYIVDPLLNVLLVEGTPEDIAQLEKFLRAQSPK